MGIVTDYFNVEDRSTDLSIHSTAKGRLMPSNLAGLESHLVDLNLSTGGLRGRFLGAGAGDFRVVLLAREILGIESYGIESDAELLQRGAAHEENLGLGITILKGDFLDSDSYLKHGMKFRDFNIIFNYHNNCGALAARILMQSPQGTLFLLNSASAAPNCFVGLSHIKTYTPSSGIQLAAKPQDNPDIMHLHIYTKER